MSYINHSGRRHPGELPVSLSTFVSRWFGLDVPRTDLDKGAISLPVMLMDASGDHRLVDVEAQPTTDGYYQALIPIGAAHYSAGIQLGHLVEWVQVEEARFHEAESLAAATGQSGGRPAPLIFEDMEEAAPGLHRCSGEESCILVPPPAGPRSGNMLMLRFIFRPVIRRSTGPRQARAAA
jgi:hypothetical protein